MDNSTWRRIYSKSLALEIRQGWKAKVSHPWPYTDCVSRSYGIFPRVSPICIDKKKKKRKKPSKENERGTEQAMARFKWTPLFFGSVLVPEKEASSSRYRLYLHSILHAERPESWLFKKKGKENNPPLIFLFLLLSRRVKNKGESFRIDWLSSGISRGTSLDVFEILHMIFMVVEDIIEIHCLSSVFS